MPRIDVHFTVTEQVLRQYPPTLLRAGDKNYFYATFDVCEKWADVAELRAVFERSDLERPYVQDLVKGTDCYECVIPWEVMQTPGLVRVGVFGGDRILTNKVDVSVSVGCRCDGDTPKSPTRDWFLRMEELINELGTPDPEEIAAAVADYIAANPIEEKDPTVPAWAKAEKKPEYSAEEVGAIARTELQTAINTALAQAKASGEFDGADGADGGYYTPAVTQTTDNTMQVVFTPSKATMPAVEGKEITLPAGPQGQQGTKGPAGADGVGIQSVVQTTTSTEDGGTNIVTVTKTDGTASTFSVKNGSKGSTGQAGANGADGKSAYAYAVEGGYTGTEAEFAAKLAAEKFANPNALTFTGAVTGSYDGSAPLTVEIPSGGGGSDWELIAEITSDGAGTNSGLFAPISFNSYKELHLEATSIADSSITFRLMLSKTTNWYDGHAIISGAATNAVAYMAHFWIIDGYIKVISGRNSGYSDAQNDGTCKFVNNPRYAFATSDYAYIRFDANNSVVPEGATLKIWGVK